MEVIKLKGGKTAATDQNYIHEEIKSRLNSRNSGYNSVQNILSFQLLSIEPNKIYNTAMLLLLE
jgi:hypothetical protein